MTKPHKKAPELRFKGFTEDWEQRKLGEMYDIVSGYAFKMGDYVQSGIPIVNGESIQHGNVSTKNLNFLPEEFSDKYKGFVLNTGDIILGLNRPITNGNLKIAQVPTDLHGALLYQRAGKIISINSSDINFSYQLLGKEVTKFVLREAVGSDQPFISTTKLKKWLIFIPSLEEQFKIGNLFERIDNLITLHKRKYKALLKLKEAYLQNMFPAKDESVPKVRFANFGGDWEQRKLGEIAEFNPKSTLPNEFEYVDLESVIGTYLVTHRTEKKSTAPSRAQRLAQKGDVFYQTVRPYQKNNYLYDLPYDNFVFSTGYAQMRPNIDSYFLLSHIQGEKFVKRVLDRCTGTSYPAINSTDLAEINIQVPTKLDEQIQIGKFFKDIENIITLHQQKLEKSNLLKEAYLQRMLI